MRFELKQNIQRIKNKQETDGLGYFLIISKNPCRNRIWQSFETLKSEKWIELEAQQWLKATDLQRLEER